MDNRQKKKRKPFPLKLVSLFLSIQSGRLFLQDRQDCISKTMIRLNTFDCKLKNTILTIRKLYQQCLFHNPLFLLACPFCGAKGTCKRRGSYGRNLVIFSDGKPEVIRLKVPRVQCSCGRSHALLPDLIVPYLSYSLPMILFILCDYFHRRLTVQGICDKYLITPPILYRFKKQFLLHKKEWLGIVRDMSLPACTFLDGLLTEPYSQFGGAYFRLTTYSFLQSHKNPADCARPCLGTMNNHPPCHNL